MRQTKAIEPECNTSYQEGIMENQPENSAPQSCQPGKPEEDQEYIGIEVPFEPAFFVGLFIIFFTADLTYLTVQEIRGPTNTLPDMIHSFVLNIGNATLTAMGLSLITILAWKVPRFIGNHIRKVFLKLFAKEPSN